MQCELAGVLSHGGYAQNRRVYKNGGLCPVIITARGSRVKIIDERPTVRVTEAGKSGTRAAVGASRIRKLTPKECWRLMGFDDEDFEKARAVCSDTQLYKQAGNSIVVNVLEGILRNLLLDGQKGDGEE